MQTRNILCKSAKVGKNMLKICALLKVGEALTILLKMKMMNLGQLPQKSCRFVARYVEILNWTMKITRRRPLRHEIDCEGVPDSIERTEFPPVTHIEIAPTMTLTSLVLD